MLERSLRAAAADGTAPVDLVVRFSSTHGLFGGGQTILIQGDRWSRTVHAVRRGTGDGSDRATDGALDGTEIGRLLSLLVELEMWRQRQPSRPGVPDEGIDTLQVTVGADTVLHSRWQRDVPTADGPDPIGRVLSLLFELCR